MIKRWIDWFFKDKNGKLAVFDWPNVPLAGWIVATVVTHLIKTGRAHTGLVFLGGAFLFLWAYLEITSGRSLFRRVLGAVVIVFTVVNRFR